MKVIVAKTAGFCWGVKRAMDAVLEASLRNDGRPVQTLGPLIHNPQALRVNSAEPPGGKSGCTSAFLWVKMDIWRKEPLHGDGL